ncbi:hypothetical protein ACFQ61_34695 [Streptomyces sp. NPDC056500]|uniref:hypothetical protein n=1 Tax=Streptomyces sp. NPDC056500 TaxID=3345840 RepID=UPI003683AAB2
MTGLGGRRQRRVWLLVGVVCGVVAVAAAVYVVRQMSHGGLKASDTAGLFAVMLAVAAGLVAVVALRKQSQANTAAFADATLARGWAVTLAGQVQAGEGAVWRQLLGDDTERINLAYTLVSGGVRPAAAPNAGRLLADGPGGATVPDIVTYYRSTRPVRLVVTGAGGAGKTVLALELLLALLDGRAEDEPVPVRVPLSRWDTEQQTLPQLLEQRLTEDYDWPRHMAASLVRHGMVLPVLDGLDEKAGASIMRTACRCNSFGSAVISDRASCTWGRQCGLRRSARSATSPETVHAPQRMREQTPRARSDDGKRHPGPPVPTPRTASSRAMGTRSASVGIMRGHDQTVCPLGVEGDPMTGRRSDRSYRSNSTAHKASWADGPLCAFDFATTGGDVETARIIAISVKFLASPSPSPDIDILVDPGVPVPADAAARHGLTSARVRAEGVPAAQALRDVANRLGANGSLGGLLIGFDLAPALTMLDREMRRHLGEGLAVTGPLIDPHIIDRALDRRAGPRTLEATCNHYHVRHQVGRNPGENALAAARLAWRLAKLHPAKVGRPTPVELHRQQIDWAEQQAPRTDANQRHRSVEDRMVTAATGVDPASDHDWPLRPYTISGPSRDETVIKAIHHKILTDWEHRLRTHGPQPFRTELHIVNDTRDVHPYFTSVRVLPHKSSYNEALFVALMGSLAKAMAADRVVIAWEPHSLRLDTWTPDTPVPVRSGYALMLADVISGSVTRLSRHPYTPPDHMGQRAFAWGHPETLERGVQTLPDPIADVVRLWREPDRDPRDAFTWKSEFQRVGYDLTEALRPR